jgi:hypothetical protein
MRLELELEHGEVGVGDGEHGGVDLEWRRCLLACLPAACLRGLVVVVPVLSCPVLSSFLFFAFPFLSLPLRWQKTDYICAEDRTDRWFCWWPSCPARWVIAKL